MNEPIVIDRSRIRQEINTASLSNAHITHPDIFDKQIIHHSGCTANSGPIYNKSLCDCGYGESRNP